MKHPVDTSTWGEFKVGELFDDIGRGTRIKKQDRVIGETPLVTAGYENQGVAEYIKENKELFQGPLLTIDMFGNAFARDYDFYADDNILVFKSSKYSFKSLLFIASALTYLQIQYDYTNQFRQQSVPKTTVKLPLKQGTNPADYSQEDIDWDYMESFMSRVQEAATKRLANLPETGQKSKTPVDVSGWGEFKVGELFDMFPGRRLKKGDFKDGDIPFVMASSYNNGVVTTLSNPISKNENFLTADIFGNVFYQKELVGYGDDNCGLKLKYRDGRPNEYLFLATMISSISVQASFTNKLRGPWYIEQAIKLPLKQETNLFDYTHDDIDWDYMESFMSQFKNLAKNRVEQLTSAHDCDILTM